MVSKKARKMRYTKMAKEIIAGKKLGKVLKDNGYSSQTAKTPSIITENKTFKEILDEILPEEYVIGEHRKLYNEHRELRQIRLETTDDIIIQRSLDGLENAQVIKNEKDGYTIILINEVDKEARKNAIEMAYKLRGSFSPIKLEVKRTYEDLTDRELIDLMKE